MKRTVHVLLISLLVILSSCEDEKLMNEPREIGEQLFEIVKNAQSTSEDDYIKYFMDFETFHDLGIKNTKEVIENTNKDLYYNQLKNYHHSIKRVAVKEGIVLNEIKYLDFIYKPSKIVEGGYLKGYLYFTYKNDSYSIPGFARTYGENYILFEVGIIEKI